MSRRDDLWCIVLLEEEDKKAKDLVVLDLTGTLESAIQTFRDGTFETALNSLVDDWKVLVYLAVEAKARASSEGRSKVRLTQLGERRLRDAVHWGDRFLRYGRLGAEIREVREAWATLMYRAYKMRANLDRSRGEEDEDAIRFGPFTIYVGVG